MKRYIPMECGVFVTLGTTVHSERGSQSGRLPSRSKPSLPVLPSAQLSEVFCSPELYQTMELHNGSYRADYFGQMSLKSSILSRPMGVSPMLMSIKTIGLVVVTDVEEAIGVDQTKRRCQIEAKRLPSWSQRRRPSSSTRALTTPSGSY